MPKHPSWSSSLASVVEETSYSFISWRPIFKDCDIRAACSVQMNEIISGPPHLDSLLVFIVQVYPSGRQDSLSRH